MARLTEVSSQPSDRGQLLTVRQLAQRMGMSPAHVYRHAYKWPFTVRVGQDGRGLRFSAAGYER